MLVAPFLHFFHDSSTFAFFIFLRHALVEANIKFALI